MLAKKKLDTILKIFLKYLKTENLKWFIFLVRMKRIFNFDINLCILKVKAINFILKATAVTIQNKINYTVK